MSARVSYEWRRIRLEITCGSCLGLIPPGNPALLITILGVKLKRWRCGACARVLGQMMPADLPGLEAQAPAHTADPGMTPLRDIAPAVEVPRRAAPAKPSTPPAPRKAFKRKAHAR